MCLITLKTKGATGESPGTNELDAGALRVNPKTKTVSKAMEDQVFIDHITQVLKETNENGKVCPNNAARIQKFSILPHDFSLNGGEMTPTLKLKNAAVEAKYASVIDKMYDPALHNFEMYVPAGIEADTRRCPSRRKTRT